MAVEMQAKLISSLEKVFLDEELTAKVFSCGSALKGERFSFQVALRIKGDEEGIRVKCNVSSSPSLESEIYEVGQIPVFHPVMQDYDDGYLRTLPGLYPDPLYHHNGNWSLAVNQWRCLMITVNIPKNAKPGEYPIKVKLERADRDGEFLCETEFSLKVIDAVLPVQTLIHTEWFHVDCIASYYNVPIFSEEHWKLIGNYMKNAAFYGVNMILTPIFTPPLDTAIGGERPTVQLVDIDISNGNYQFGFEKLDRYMSLAEKNGIKRFEISHLFTQWGAVTAPKIVADENGTQRQIFGWNTDSGSKEYGCFLQCFLKALKKHLRDVDRFDRCMFHISDEPDKNKIDCYARAISNTNGELDDCHVIDALSDYSFYEKGFVRNPIPPVDVIGEFLEKGFQHPWTYYCSGQRKDVSNRFVAMPSARNRVIGSQLYKFNVEGFLQWGFNFWYSSLSRELINPFTETGCSDAFPAGDGYLVYPGEDGNPLPSIREIVFYDALQDMRAMQLLEALTDKQTVLNVIDSDDSLTFKNYPKTAEQILQIREDINQLIDCNLKKKHLPNSIAMTSKEFVSASV